MIRKLVTLFLVLIPYLSVYSASLSPVIKTHTFDGIIDAKRLALGPTTAAFISADGKIIQILSFETREPSEVTKIAKKKMRFQSIAYLEQKQGFLVKAIAKKDKETEGVEEATHYFLQISGSAPTMGKIKTEDAAKYIRQSHTTLAATKEQDLDQSSVDIDLSNGVTITQAAKKGFYFKKTLVRINESPVVALLQVHPQKQKTYMQIRSLNNPSPDATIGFYLQEISGKMLEAKLFRFASPVHLWILHDNKGIENHSVLQHYSLAGFVEYHERIAKSQRLECDQLRSEYLKATPETDSYNFDLEDHTYRGIGPCFGTLFNPEGFDYTRRHQATGTKQTPDGFDIDGKNHDSQARQLPNGSWISRYGFLRSGLHYITGEAYFNNYNRYNRRLGEEEQAKEKIIERNEPSPEPQQVEADAKIITTEDESVTSPSISESSSSEQSRGQYPWLAILPQELQNKATSMLKVGIPEAAVIQGIAKNLSDADKERLQGIVSGKVVVPKNIVIVKSTPIGLPQATLKAKSGGGPVLALDQVLAARNNLKKVERTNAVTVQGVNYRTNLRPTKQTHSINSNTPKSLWATVSDSISLRRAFIVGEASEEESAFDDNNEDAGSGEDENDSDQFKDAQEG